jgi:hypothetical protein
VPVFLVLCCEFHFTALRIGYRVLRVTARESKAFLLDFLLSSPTTGRIPYQVLLQRMMDLLDGVCFLRHSM